MKDYLLILGTVIIFVLFIYYMPRRKIIKQTNSYIIKSVPIPEIASADNLLSMTPLPIKLEPTPQNIIPNTITVGAHNSAHGSPIIASPYIPPKFYAPVLPYNGYFSY